MEIFSMAVKLGFFQQQQQTFEASEIKFLWPTKFLMKNRRAELNMVYLNDRTDDVYS